MQIINIIIQVILKVHLSKFLEKTLIVLIIKIHNNIIKTHLIKKLK